MGIDHQSQSPQTPVTHNWRRNLWVVWIGEVVALAGFDAAIPFLPYYIQELGVVATTQVQLWTGLLTSAQSWSMSIMSPIWGSLADRVGRKVMLMRAMFSAGLLLAAMAFVTDVRQLLVLRIIQGGFSGTVAAAQSLVAATVPFSERAFALGAIQTATYVGASLGPSIGGFVADSWGYRACFIATGILLSTAGLMVGILAQEGRPGMGQRKRIPLAQGWRTVVTTSGVLPVLGIRFLMNAGLRMADPMLPLYVQALSTGDARVASMTGLLNSARMIATAAGGLVIGRYADRLDVFRVTSVCLAAAAAGYLASSMANGFAQLLGLASLSGVAIGGLAATLSSALSRAVAEDKQGTVFGLQASVQAAANGVAPIVGAVIASTLGLRSTFMAASFCLALAFALSTRRRSAPASDTGT